MYGLNSFKRTTKKLLDLLCQYGNVVETQFLKNKNGSAMAQTEDHSTKEGAVGHKNNSQFSAKKMHLEYTNQAFMNDVLPSLRTT